MEKSHKCDFCEKKFTSRANVEQHIRWQHPGPSPVKMRERIEVVEIPSPKEHPCPQCPKSYHDKGSLTKHEKLVHGGIVPWKCDFCRKNLPSKFNRDRHMQTCKEKPIQDAGNARDTASEANTDANSTDIRLDADETLETTAHSNPSILPTSVHDDSSISSNQSRQQKRVYDMKKVMSSGQDHNDSDSSDASPIDFNQPGPSDRGYKRSKKHRVREEQESSAKTSTHKPMSQESAAASIEKRQSTLNMKEHIDEETGNNTEPKKHVCCNLTANEITFNTENLDCLGSEECFIAVGAEYMKQIAPTAEDPETFCLPCYKKLRGVKNADYQLTTNLNPESESSVFCMICNDMYHMICASHFPQISQEFICAGCGGQNPIKKTVDNEEKTQLDRHLESVANAILKGVMGEEPTSNRVNILSFLTKTAVPYTELYPEGLLTEENCNQETTYFMRALYLFQRRDGIDIPIFIFFCQEYPESRTVMLDYLDSVPFADPPNFKGRVIKGVTLAYFEYLKAKGYTNLHLWSKAPRQCESFIHHIHPSDQNYLTQEELQQWYMALFAKGIKDNVFASWRSFDKEEEERKFAEPMDLPVFHHSLWSSEIHKAVEKISPWVRYPTIKSRVMKHMRNKVFPVHNKDNFFAEFKDPATTLELDAEKHHPYMAERMAFNNQLSKQNWEFSTIRRAKYTSLAIINLLLPQQ